MENKIEHIVTKNIFLWFSFIYTLKNIKNQRRIS